jgi:glutamate formiminotransferase
LVICVPNCSEGNRESIIQALAASIRLHAILLDIHSDPHYNRSVFTFIGTEQSLLEAATSLIGASLQLIDINLHQGLHPRMGATDIVPFVPLEDEEVDIWINAAKKLAHIIWQEFSIPVYFYGHPALSKRRTVSDIRGKGYEDLKHRIMLQEWHPDVGEPRLHPTFGAIAVGVRPPLIAYNMVLQNVTLQQARQIARSIRESSGGIPGIQAMALEVAGSIQISTNILDYKKCGPGLLTSIVRKLAQELGGDLDHAELVGLIPEHASKDVHLDPAASLAVEGKILEQRISEKQKEAIS